MQDVRAAAEMQVGTQHLSQPPPTSPRQTEDKEAPGGPQPCPEPPHLGAGQVCNSWDHPQRPRPEGQAAGFRGPQAPLPGSCAVPPRNSPSTHCPSPHPDRTGQKQRHPEAWEQEGLVRTPPWSEEPKLGVPTCTEGSFLPF